MSTDRPRCTEPGCPVRYRHGGAGGNAPGCPGELAHLPAWRAASAQNWSPISHSCD